MNWPTKSTILMAIAVFVGIAAILNAIPEIQKGLEAGGEIVMPSPVSWAVLVVAAIIMGCILAFSYTGSTY